MKYEPKDLPSIKGFDEHLPAFKTIIKANKFFSFFGLGSKRIKSLEADFENILKQKGELENYPTKFNRYFGDEGWIIHDSLSFEIVKKAVDLVDEEKREDAKKLIMDSYSPEEMEGSLIYFKYIPEFQMRTKFLQFALDDYKAGRYYSCVPLLIMTIDGAINDVMQKGFHAKNIDLNVWDSITATDTGILVIRDIYQTGRHKTTEEEIKQPFRNGILHGRDLGYDNYELAAKCWAHLFVIRDWIISKKNEDDRIKIYEKENKKVTWKELIAQISELNESKKSLANWKPRIIEKAYISQINEGNNIEENSPEEMLINFLNYWGNSNYGMMAKLYSELITDNPKKFAGEVRNMFQDKRLIGYKIRDINDDAASITEIEVKAEFDNNLNENKTLNFRCIYEKGKNEPVSRDRREGKWKMVLVNNL